MYRSSFQEFVATSLPENAEVLFFTAHDFSEIEWMEEGKEFDWKGKLYDVSKIEKTDDGFKIYGVNDSFEQEFLSMLDDLKKSHSPAAKTRVIFQPHFCNRLDFEGIDRDYESPVRFSFVFSFYLPPMSEACSPPPRAAC